MPISNEMFIFSWKLRLSSCSYDLSLTILRASEYLPAILNHCMIYSDPPDGAVQHQMRLCGLSTLTKCQSATDMLNSDFADNANRCLNGPSMYLLK